MGIREVLRRFQEDESLRAELAKVVAALFSVFLEDWFRWEIMGWVLALYLGWSERDIRKHPELGWVAKAICAAVLLNSPHRRERLLGNAILYHTEIPPQRLFVAYGGDLLPAIVYHYQQSAKQPHIIKEAIGIFKKVKEKLGGEEE